jgi:hypothetical protein
MTPTDRQCELLLKKHGVPSNGPWKEATISAIKEAYRAGRNSDVMHIVQKEEK